ncbi:MAG TPA: hypothetical protein VF911_16675 [Thermoanaerobaculia bacterium]
MEQGSFEKSERRGSPRLRVADTIPALIGRGAGFLVDLSEHGAKIRHTSVVRRGSAVRIAFEWERRRFSASAEVVGSRLVCVGSVERPAMYESRLRFTCVSSEAQQVLARTLDALAGRDMRRWVANLRGWQDEIAQPTAPAVAPTAFLRCRLLGIRWEVKSTNDVTQPPDGFLLPAGIDDNDIVKLCADYLRADTDGRHVMRMMAAAAVEQSIAEAAAHGALARSA